MSGLLQFSGIATKVRAMQRWLLSDADLARMRACGSVPEAVAFLRGVPQYESALRNIPDARLHRGVIEKQLILTEYLDFDRLYRFADANQKAFLRLYFQRFELSALKRCLRRVAAGGAVSEMEAYRAETDRQADGTDLSGTLTEKQAGLLQFAPFFERYSHMDFPALVRAERMEDLLVAVKDSPYGALLALLSAQGGRLIDYEAACDMRYFRTLWERSRKQLAKADRDIIEKTVGAKIDLLNLTWLYRAKKYYALDTSALYALLIPICYRLKKEEVQAMAEAEDVGILLAQMQRTGYGSSLQRALADGLQMEAWFSEVLDRVYQLSSQKHPYSIACLNTYFYMKEREISRIINAIEEVRYGTAALNGGGGARA